jgi:hypothetical protein
VLTRSLEDVEPSRSHQPQRGLEEFGDVLRRAVALDLLDEAACFGLV